MILGRLLNEIGFMKDLIYENMNKETISDIKFFVK